MHEISPVTFWLHDLKGVENPPPRGAGQKLPQAPAVTRPQLGPPRSPPGTSRRKSEFTVSFYSSGDL